MLGGREEYEVSPHAPLCSHRHMRRYRTLGKGFRSRGVSFGSRGGQAAGLIPPGPSQIGETGCHHLQFSGRLGVFLIYIDHVWCHIR